VSSGSDSGCVKTHQARKYGDWYFSDQAKLGAQEQRREFIALLGSAVVAWLLAARAAAERAYAAHGVLMNSGLRMLGKHNPGASPLARHGRGCSNFRDFGATQIKESSHHDRGHWPIRMVGMSFDISLHLLDKYTVR
jgi:hypothetical protein